VRRFERACFVGGLVLLGWFVWRIGPEQIGRNLAEVGWGFAPIFAFAAVPLFLNAVSWSRVLPEGSGVSLGAVARMLLAGEAINAVSPVAVVSGEIVRASLLSAELPAEDAVACVAMAAMAQFFAQVLFVITGLPLALALIADAALRRGFLIVSGILLALFLAVLALAVSSAARGSVRSILARIRGVRAVVSLPDRWRAAGREALAALRARPARFGSAVVASLLAWQAGAVETWLILRFLQAPVGARQAYAIEVLAVVIEGALFFVPAKIGTQEGGKMLIFLGAGLDVAKGFMLGFVRRLRELCWAAVGFGILGRLGRSRALREADTDSRQLARLT
jgi:Lysylphosphatidylglycerol synthase TM region